MNKKEKPKMICNKFPPEAFDGKKGLISKMFRLKFKPMLCFKKCRMNCDGTCLLEE